MNKNGSLTVNGMMPVETLKAAGLKATPQRTAILKYLWSTSEHPTVEAVHMKVKDDFPSISLNTVYSTLCTMEHKGLARRIDAGDGLCRYDGNSAPHAHISCTRCRRVDDVHGPEPKLDMLEDEARQVMGYKVEDYAIYFYGLCPECREKTNQ
jgi:Fur family peroxide stress response transcriptional regulator